MLASLVKLSVEEISWDGPPGISWAKLLYRLRATGHQMDKYMQESLWKEISSKRTPILIQEDRHHELPAEAETEDSDDRDCSHPRSSRNRGKLVLHVSDAVRWHCLRLDAHPDIAENELSIRSLQLVAQRRWKGCSASLLSSELNVTSCNLFYLLEGLRLAGLLVGVLTLPSKATAADAHGNLFYFSRFFDPESVEQREVQVLLKTSASALKNKILATLNATDSKVAFEGGLRSVLAQVLDESALKPDISRRAAGRIYQRLRSELMASGKVECVRAWDAGSKTYRDALCIPGHVPKQPVLAIEDIQSDKRPGTRDVVQPSEEQVRRVADPLPESFVHAQVSTACVRSAERSTSQQAEDLIRCCSRFGRGITSPDISSLLGIRRKQTERILNTLVKKKRATRVFESDGKAHFNRYFDSPATCMGAYSVPQSSGKHGLKLQDGRASKALKIVSAGRVDATFVRRIQRTSELLEETGMLTTTDLKKAGLQDEVLGSMDTKTPTKIFKALASTEERVGLVMNAADQVEFAFWKPSHTESSARQVAADNAEIRRENRFQKIRRPENEKEEGMKLPKKSVPLALLDRPWSAPSSMMQLMTRRVLPEDIVAERVSQLGKTGTVASVPRTLDQKVLQHYGFNSSLVSRIHLLHGMLLRRQGFDKSARWTPTRIVDEMDLHIFLQVIGCGLYDPDLDKLLATGSNPLVCQASSARVRKCVQRQYIH